MPTTSSTGHLPKSPKAATSRRTPRAPSGPSQEISISVRNNTQRRRIEASGGDCARTRCFFFRRIFGNLVVVWIERVAARGAHNAHTRFGPFLAASHWPNCTCGEKRVPALFLNYARIAADRPGEQTPALDPQTHLRLLTQTRVYRRNWLYANELRTIVAEKNLGGATADEPQAAFASGLVRMAVRRLVTVESSAAVSSGKMGRLRTSRAARSVSGRLPGP